MATVIASALYFSNGKTAVRMSKDGSLTAIGATFRTVPFDSLKFEKFAKNELQYATSRTNVQGLIESDKATFDAIQKGVNAQRKETATQLATFEGFDSAEIDRAVETCIDKVSGLSVQLADAKAELTAVRTVQRGGADKAANDAAKAAKKAQKEAAEKATKLALANELAVLAAKYGKTSIAGVKAATAAA